MLGLFAPFSRAGLDLANRIVLPPMATELATEEGFVTEQLIDHYRARAGVGLIIVEHAFINNKGKNSNRQLSVADDNVVAGLSDLAKEIKSQGPMAVLQINHAGSAAKPEVTGLSPVGPWHTPHPGRGVQPQALTESDMEEISSQFVAAARRAAAAGFDGVEIHGAHGFLLSQFLSPLTNQRPDQYGGDMRGRSQFPLAVTAAVRAAVGADYPVLYRLGVCDLAPGGLTLAEGIEFCQQLIGLGVQVLDISVGFGGFGSLSGPGYLLEYARAVKEATTAVVINAGGLGDPVVADQAIRNNAVDLVAVGRQMLSEPDWPRRARSIICG